MFDEIKKVCNLVSKEAAKSYAQKTNKKFKEGGKDSPRINDLKEQIEALCAQHDIVPSFGPVQSGFETPDGKIIDFIAFNQAFYKQAPILGKFTDKLLGMFTIEEKGNSLTVKGVQNFSELAPCLASYFVGSEITFAVSILDGAILELQGCQVAGGSRDEEGRILLDVNIEHELTMNDLIHEIVHVKVPEEIQKKVSHTFIDQIGNEVEKRLKIPIKKPLSIIDSLKEEYLKILTAFKELDQDLLKSNLFS